MASAIGDFTYKRKVTIDTTSGGANISSSLSSFPVCVHIDSNSWTTSGDRTAFFGAYNSGGKRVQFFASDQTTNLAYEVDRYDSGSEIATYWVAVGTVTGNSTTDIYVAYGNDPNSSDQDQGTSVWDSNFVAVYHLQAADGSGHYADSTANGYTLDNHAGITETTGAPINSGVNGTGDDYLYTNTITSVFADNDPDITISAWTRQTSAASHQACAGIAGDYNLQPRRSLYTYHPSYSDQFCAECYGVATYSSTRIAGTTYYHLAATWPKHATYTGALANIGIYVNGVSDYNGNTGGSYSNLGSTGANFAVNCGGYFSPNTHRFNGDTDEVRFSKSIRSADWIKGEYWSMKKTSWPGDGWMTWSAAEGGSVGNMYYIMAQQ